jgi:putative ABC transport system permease protein
MIAVVLASLNERRRELAILRSVGAGAGTVLGLLMAEGSLLLLAGCVLGAGSLWLACVAAAPWLEAQFGIVVPLLPLTLGEARWLGIIIAAGALASLLPGWRAYRLSLADGLSARI